MPIYNQYYLDRQKQFDPKTLEYAGPVLPVEVLVPSVLEQFFSQRNQPIPTPKEGLVLIDTGATKSCVDEETIKALGVNPIGTISVGTAAGPQSQGLYPAKFRFPGIKDLMIEFSSVAGVNLSGQKIAGQNIIALLGRDVLLKCVLVYNGPGGFFTLAF